MPQLIGYFYTINVWHLSWIIYGPLPIGGKEKGMPLADQVSNLRTLPTTGPNGFHLFSFDFFFSCYYYFVPLRKVAHVSKEPNKEKRKLL